MIECESALTRLRDSGLRVTPQRRAVIEALCGNREHPSAEDVASLVSSRMPGVSLSTVYKTLHEFAALGLVRELGLPGSMRFDPDVRDHAHLVCEECGHVVDVDIPSDLLGGVELPSGVAVTGVHVSLTGRCASCERAGRNAGEKN